MLKGMKIFIDIDTQDLCVIIRACWRGPGQQAQSRPRLTLKPRLSISPGA